MLSLKEFGLRTQKRIDGYSYFGVVITSCISGKDLYVRTTEGDYVFDIIDYDNFVRSIVIRLNARNYTSLYSCKPLIPTSYPLPLP